MKVILQTERLFLRELVEGDIPDLKEILQDRRVMYAYGHDFSDADVRAWYERQQRRYAALGFGLWAAVEKDSGAVVGQAGLTMQPCEGAEVLEVGYLLKWKYWHRGYAREAARACRDYAFETLGTEKVFSIIRTDNLPSIRVAEGIGMRREREFMARYYAGDMRHYLYGVQRGEQAGNVANGV